MIALHLRLIRACSLIVLMALMGCVTPPPTPVSAPPPPPHEEPKAKPQSAESLRVQAYYAQVQDSLLARGLMRTDGGGQDAPFTDTMLAESFIRVALFDEYARSPLGPVQRATPSVLRRWEEPVRVSLRFGASVSKERQATDRALIGSFLKRLQKVSGHPILLTDESPNFFIFVVDEDERRGMGHVFSSILPGLSSAELRGITDMPLSTYCLVYAMSPNGQSAYTRALAVIRAEHPDLMELSCIHEEVTQGLGLANDSPDARPSIFNDDEEFALLTPMDEMMLKMLYDKRLTTGMTEAEARPIVYSLATELVGGNS
ncbi:DUF2927 domain-containing protein [Tabrizicola sp. J26]|uniref:DUF2927 domain-containing protein n=1 Tax=Alitabrizicola rongguiensis TaxID=2909234 RepID=UPI001F2BC2AE|nr:DUF2927 domain-containing protein [Tabrizicola rongguiensis]MCF1708776.1 DUF2927 domain-containing protein [Tabrizicola rongguiensis]